MHHHLYIDADFKIEDAWELPKPNSYEVNLSEPLMKGGIDVSDFAQHVSIIVALQQVGLIDWAVSAAYDELWVYLKNYFGAVPQTTTAASASLKVKDAEGKLRVSLVGMSSKELAGAKVALKETITKDASGNTTEQKTIEITLAKPR